MSATALVDALRDDVLGLLVLAGVLGLAAYGAATLLRARIRRELTGGRAPIATILTLAAVALVGYKLIWPLVGH